MNLEKSSFSSNRFNSTTCIVRSINSARDPSTSSRDGLNDSSSFSMDILIENRADASLLLGSKFRLLQFSIIRRKFSDPSSTSSNKMFFVT